jgi:4-methyl-5(b-hydroxyethyl)-thiazole monophosphate biosynthesis
MSKKILAFLADGFEEVEAVTPIDYLRRAGIEVLTVAIGDNKTVVGAHKAPLVADILMADLSLTDEWDAVFLPGGMPGAANLAASPKLDAILRETERQKRLICAICASPAVVLSPKGLLKGHRWTCYPGLEDKTGSDKANWSAEKTVVDGSLITARGAGIAAAFSLAIIETLINAEAAQKLAASVLL